MGEIKEKRNGKEIETKLTNMPSDIGGGAEKGAWTQCVPVPLRPSQRLKRSL